MLRRRAWYAALIDLDEHLKLPESILAEQTLLNSGISADHQLLIRSAIAGDMTIEKVNMELIAQHSRVHEQVSHGAHRGKGHFMSRHPHRSWRDRGKGSGFRSYMAEDIYGEDDWYDDGYNAYAGEMDREVGNSNDLDPNYDFEEFTEHDALAMMAAEGVDLDDEAEYEAYLTRSNAAYKGFKGFKGKGRYPGPRQFNVQGQLSLSECQQKIAQLKERTACRRCGQVGHWSSDPSCPKGKGGKSKGKTTSSSSLDA